jgi:hypothetical protein
MDMSLYLRVLWRFKFIVAVGFVLAVALAFASLAKVDYGHGSVSVSYRQKPTYQSTTRIFVTQAGFPWGRSVFPAAPPTPTTTTGDPTSGLEFADPTRFAGLAIIYAQLINGDLIQGVIRRDLPPGDVLRAAAVVDAASNSSLPLIDIGGLAHSPVEAERASRAAARLFQSYITGQQASAGIPLNQRVLLQVVSNQTTLEKGRKKTLAIVTFLAVMVATLGLAFILENLRPRVRAVAPPAVPASRVGTSHTA